MKNFIQSITKLFVLLAMVMMTNCEKDIVAVEQPESNEQELKGAITTAEDVPHIFDFIKSKTNETLKVGIQKDKIELGIDVLSREPSAMGDINTRNVIRVSDPEETVVKYTF